jgi:hypothetical protein
MPEVYELDGDKDYRTRNIVNFNNNTKNKSYKDSEIASLIETNYQNVDFKIKTFQINDRVFQLQSKV